MTAPRLACLADHSTYLAWAAQRLLREREARYPAAIESGAISAEEAARKILLARAVAAQWAWVDDRADPPAPAFDPDGGGPFGAPDHELAAELADAAARAAKLAAADPASWEKRELADLYAALAWWQQPPTGQPTGEARVVAFVGGWRASGVRVARELAA